MLVSQKGKVAFLEGTGRSPFTSEPKGKLMEGTGSLGQCGLRQSAPSTSIHDPFIQTPDTKLFAFDIYRCTVSLPQQAG